MAGINPLMCCGVKEISIHGDPPEAVMRYVKASGWSAAYFIFTMPVGQIKDLEAVVEYIRANKLGEVYSPPRKRNPNSGNTLCLAVWSVDQAAWTRHRP